MKSRNDTPLSPHTNARRRLQAWAIPAALAMFVGLTGLLSAEEANDATKGSAAYAVPESPAFTFLGASPASVSQPGTARDLAIQLVNAFDEQGRVRQGFALELRAAYLNPIPLDRYQRFWPRLVYNAQLSAGTVETPGATGSTDIAVGLRVTLVDKSDPMLSGHYVQDLAAVINECKPQQPGDPKDNALACMAERSKKIREDWVEAHWNAFKLSIAFATGWQAPGSVITDAAPNGWSVWGAASVPIGHRGQFVGQLQYTHVPDQAVTADKAPDEVKFGGRGFLGNGRLNAFLELTGSNRYGLREGSDGGKNSWSGGLEYRISEHTWVSTGLGSSFGDEGTSSKMLVLANLRFALSDESRIQR